ncbi:AraR protein [Sulfobacillus acidophilus TPY]|uniref:Transcriptional regulator, GntR family with LacI sensor n=1 Tax=Sulfobacillus acidophilus (strain ATCC 700253 / DSM 10332 / NAL) TaxID=679936 RepID=G8TSY9_SULAD|nr:AraR protein [Sulfobacillus acidophilus TPY]AEW05604.1 transcriptional regulator, GntR family with LacI sensor [Sulfobacillus acidophilus DSM 10332]
MPQPRIPQYITIANELRQIILQGGQAGEQIPTESDLMTRYGVSRHTVRQALNQLVHENLLVRVPGRGTFVAEPPPSIPAPTATQNLVAVIMTYISDYIFPSIIRGIERQLREHGFNLLLLSTQNQFDLERRALETALAQGCRGIIFEPVKSTMPNPNRDLYQHIYAEGLPVVMLHAEPAGFPAFHTILFDDLAGAQLITEHVLSQGHRALGGIFKIDDKQGVSRLKGYIAALNHRHLAFNPDTVSLFTTESKDIVTKEYVRARFGERADSPTAVVCYNDDIAVRLVKSLRAAGLRVPADVSVVGFDDSPLATVTHPELTTIRHPQEKMGRLAADDLLRMIQENPPRAQEGTRIVLPADLVVRHSVAAIRLSGKMA